MKFNLLMLCLMCLSVSLFAQPKITAVKKPSQIEILIDGKLFTTYIVSAEEKYPYFFPVNGPSGASVTSMRNGNYPHHSSLFFGCDKVNGGNYWQEGLDRGQIVSLRAEILENEGSRIVIENECIWTRPQSTAPIRDIRKIMVSVPSEKLFQLDFEIELEMLEPVHIEKTNHSLFSARLDPDLAVVHGGIMINAENMAGEKDTFGKASPWMDYFGTRGNNFEGIAILQHPSNPWYPSPWFTRDYGFISPTPMFWPENGESYSFEKGEKIKLKYRVLVHQGDHKTAGIQEAFNAYSRER